MPKLQQTANATVSTTKEIRLEPKLRKKILTELRTYAGLHDQLKAIQHAMDKKKAIIGELRNETGEQSVELEGFKVTLVAPTRRKFDPKKFVTLGGDIEVYNEANVETLTTPYEKITCPGVAEEE